MTGKPLLYLSDDRNAALPGAIEALASARTVATSPAGKDSETLAQLVNRAGGDLCDVIATGRAAVSALDLAARHPEMIDKLVLDTPVLNGDTTSGPDPESLTAQLLIVLGDKAPQASATDAVALRRKYERAHLAYVYDATDSAVDSQPERYRTLVLDFLQRGVAFVLKPDKAATTA